MVCALVVTTGEVVNMLLTNSFKNLLKVAFNIRKGGLGLKFWAF